MAKESEGENDDEEEEKRKRKKRGMAVLCVHSVSTLQNNTCNVFYTRGTEYEDLLDEDYELLQENLGIKIAVSLPYTTQ